MRVEAVTITQLGAQIGVFLAQPALFHARAEHARELGDLERLDQEVGRAAFDRRDRLGHSAETRDHDREDVGIASESRVQDVHAIGVRQPEIHDQGVVGECLQPLLRFFGVRGLRDGETIRGQRLRDQLAEISLVVHDKNSGLSDGRHRVTTRAHTSEKSPLIAADG